MIVIPIIAISFIFGFIVGALIAIDYYEQYYHLRGGVVEQAPTEMVALDIGIKDKDSSNNTVALDSNSMELLVNSGGGDCIHNDVVDKNYALGPSQYRVVRGDDVEQIKQ